MEDRQDLLDKIIDLRDRVNELENDLEREERDCKSTLDQLRWIERERDIYFEENEKLKEEVKQQGYEIVNKDTEIYELISLNVDYKAKNDLLRKSDVENQNLIDDIVQNYKTYNIYNFSEYMENLIKNLSQ
jgi:hypothetical protein